MSQTFPTPDIAHWSKITCITGVELAALLEWIDPIVVNGDGDGIENFIDLTEADTKIRRAIITGELTPVSTDATGTTINQPTFRASQVGAWAQSIGHTQLALLFDAQLKAAPIVAPVAPITRAQTKNALALHEAEKYFEKHGYSSDVSPKQQIRKFLKDSDPNMSDDICEALSTVLNPNPKGGRPRKSLGQIDKHGPDEIEPA